MDGASLITHRPSQRKLYGYFRCTSGVFGGVTWTQWLMIDLRMSHFVSDFVYVPPISSEALPQTNKT
uniref:Uncharacterized protein n=1 Tax=Candidatus Kentrum sp. MB TaxID=2138164 RepID=A0A451BFZ1_9GAMM|nr:MAG: hypothetical protein BECKMB1821I_GA0114274_110710 [Candidatus Kentron sp. MB]VFK77203.1 MAG: hypothetical protein BECKMB1821H_GA0114242_110910 [Candidatus Kentron sp. MB]